MQCTITSAGGDLFACISDDLVVEPPGLPAEFGVDLRSMLSRTDHGHDAALLEIIDLREHSEMLVCAVSLGGFGYLAEGGQHRQHTRQIQ